MPFLTQVISECYRDTFLVLQGGAGATLLQCHTLLMAQPVAGPRGPCYQTSAPIERRCGNDGGWRVHGHEILELQTTRRCEMVDVTAQVSDAVGRLGIAFGAVMVHSPHTTAAITINEGADPDVCADILRFLEGAVPHRADYRHAEGNADAHIKTTLVGTTRLVPVEGGRVVLGTWQRIFFCEFDGPRSRRVFVRALV